MKRIYALGALVCLLLALAGCGTSVPPEENTESPVTEEPASNGSDDSDVTLESLCGEDYPSYLIETVTMQMENRMQKDPDVAFFPITENAPLTDYVAIDETTSFEVNEDGDIVLHFPAGSVTDEAHGEQSFIIPVP